MNEIFSAFIRSLFFGDITSQNTKMIYKKYDKWYENIENILSEKTLKDVWNTLNQWIVPITIIKDEISILES